MPRYLQDAVPTAIGHAHPISGYQLDSTKSLSSPTAYYKPNDGRYAFVDPAHTATPAQLVFFQRDQFGSLGVDVALHSLYQDITNVSWNFGDGTTIATGNWQSRHVYAAAGTFTITATGTSTAAGTITASVSVTVDKTTAKPANTVAPVLSTQAPVVGTPVTVTAGTWTNGGTITYQWKVAGANISAATTASYTPVTGDATKVLSVVVTNTNSHGATAITETAATAVSLT